MTSVFVDALYWIAIFNPKDRHHQAALHAENRIQGRHLVTTEAVLNEFLSAVSGGGERIRLAATDFVWNLLNDADVDVVPASSKLFQQGLNMYQQRADKAYSCVDCMSMVVMKEQKINEIPTLDRHFSQESFLLLMEA